MKTFFRNLWSSRDNIVFLWVFLFALSLVGENSDPNIRYIIVSGMCSIAVISLGILLAMIKNRKRG